MLREAEIFDVDPEGVAASTEELLELEEELDSDSDLDRFDILCSCVAFGGGGRLVIEFEGPAAAWDGVSQLLLSYGEDQSSLQVVLSQRRGLKIL